jgi:hypothetical protein
MGKIVLCGDAKLMDCPNWKKERLRIEVAA